MLNVPSFKSLVFLRMSKENKIFQSGMKSTSTSHFVPQRDSDLIWYSFPQLFSLWHEGFCHLLGFIWTY